LAKKERFMLRLSLVLMLLFASPVWAGTFQDGNSLYEACSGDELDRTYCVGYITSVADIMETDTLYVFKACSMDNVTGRQLLDVVTGWLAEHPRDRHHNATTLVAWALSETFPC